MVETRSTLIWSLRDDVSAGAAKVQKSVAGIDKAAKAGGQSLGGLGGALSGLVSPQAIVGAGAFALAGFMVGAFKAAADEEIGIRKLDTALKANVKGWDGNTAAVSDYIDKTEEASAFNDGDLRDSLAQLVTSTHDVTKAEKLQALSMDLARLKGVDLATATTAVIKTSQGSTREMKALGIAVTDGASATENLSKVQAAAAGQMDAYGNSTAGALDKIGNRFHNLQEDLGGRVIGLLDDTGKEFDGIQSAADDATTALHDFLWDADKVHDSAKILNPIIDRGADAFSDMADAAGNAADNLGDVDDIIKKLKSRHAWELVATLDDLASQANSHSIGGESGRGTWHPPKKKKKKPKTHADGGTIDPGEWGTVDESGPGELLYNAGSNPVGVAPNGGGGQVTINLVVDGKKLAQIVDKHLYYAAANAAPTQVRT